MIRAAVFAAAVAVALAGIAGCGEGQKARPPAAHTGAALPTAKADGQVVIAEVGGVPVTADCVRAQAAAHHVDGQAALAECIDFEILAIEAAKRGYGDDPDVAAARRTEAVRNLIEADFLASYDGPEDISIDDLHDAWRGIRSRFNHPEIRFTFHVRAEVPEGSPPEADAEARKLATDIAGAFAGKGGVTIDEFKATALRVAGDRPLRIGQSLNFARHSGTAEKFAAATFAIRKNHTVSPPVRTHWGWDVILLNDILPAASMPFEDAEAKLREKLFPAARVKQFERWVGARAKAAGAKIDDDKVAAAFAPPAPGSQAAPESER